MKQFKRRLAELEQLSKRKPKQNDLLKGWTDLFASVEEIENPAEVARNFINECKAKGVPPTWVELAIQAKQAEEEKNENAERNL